MWNEDELKREKRKSFFAEMELKGKEVKEYKTIFTEKITKV